MGIVEEECDETIYWMHLLVKSNSVGQNDVESLMREANQIIAMTVSSIKTARSNLNK